MTNETESRERDNVVRPLLNVLRALSGLGRGISVCAGPRPATEQEVRVLVQADISELEAGR